MLEKNSSVQLNKNSEIRRQKQTKFFFVGLLFAMVVIAGVIGFLRKSEFQISEIGVVGTRALDPVRVETAAKDFIAGNYLLVIPKTNALIFSKIKMRNYLLAEFPGMQDVVAEFESRNRVVIRIVEKQPAYVWCNSACWFVDGDGVIYDEAPEFSDGVFLKFEGNTSDGHIDGADSRRGRFASPADFARMQEILTVLSEYPVHILGIRYLDEKPFFGPASADATDGRSAQPTGPGDIAIRMDSLKDNAVAPEAVILITKNTDAESLSQALDLLMNEGKFTDMLRANGKKLQYVDLRFTGKIYYKFTQ